MYAFRLPGAIPAAGAPGGPPRPETYRSLGGTPGGMDMVAILQRCILDPNQLRPTMDKIMADFERRRVHSICEPIRRTQGQRLALRSHLRGRESVFIPPGAADWVDNYTPG